MKALRLLRSGRSWASAWLACQLCVLASATTVVPPEFEQLVNESDYVVRAVVESTRSEYRDGPQGRLIVTYVKLRVTENVVGDAPAVFELEMLGGRIGDDQLTVAGAPILRPGDEDFLFVSGNGRNFHPLYALGHGRYPVKRDAKTGREFIARSNAVPLQSVAEIKMPLTSGSMAERQLRAARSSDALTPADFSAQIKAAYKDDYARAHVN